MAYNPNFKPVLLTAEQMEAIKRLQEQEREKSVLKVAPTISAITRGLVDKALKQLEA
ncbi:Uncharacterised protein [Cedecea lapagei]|uniref:Uncharacterized protein n=1 Tax=Cedecea lapagei TaxID=158823 RepID=A0A3S4IRU8_9ENTR|nr:hypothetical protein [Cedecea lapagei]VEC02018.1 Uncharacterised protein [Cedecea lapagei]